MRIYIRHINIFLVSIGLLILFIHSSCRDDIEKGSFITTNQLNISAFLSQSDNYTVFAELLEETQLFDALNSYNPYGDGFTLFAPTNEAITKFIEDSDDYNSMESLISDSAFLNMLVRFHIVMSAYNTNQFPFGALDDSTITGDYLTIGFQSQNGQSTFLINNNAELIDPNNIVSNGYIHGLNDVLDPIIFSSYEWLKMQEGVSIFLNLLEQTGLSDTMGINKLNAKGNLVRNRYSLFVEPDSVLGKRGIHSFQDLVEMFGTPGLDYDDRDNSLYQFAAYHILENVLFLDDMNSGIYNSFTVLPVQIRSGVDIVLNPGSKKIIQSVQGQDTVFIKNVPIIYEISNNPSKNGPIHYISEILELYKPRPDQVTFHFDSEPLINELSNTEGSFSFNDPSVFEYITWSGADELIYVKGIEAQAAWNNDYIELDGSFSFSFITPRIFPGKYNFMMRLHANDYANAIIQVYLDDKRIGANLNLKSNSGNSDFVVFNTGNIDFLDYNTHVITINTVIPGRMQLDMIRFDP